MSNPIDNRVVQMQFDNAAFEKGVKQTTESLRNLDKVIDQSTLGGRLSGTFSKLGNVLGNLIPTKQIFAAADAVATSVESIFARTYNTVSSVAKVGAASITAMGAAITGLAATGGMRRALNIEQAQFQLKGLMKDAYNWETISEDLNYAVSGTAYGLDSAARAAAQLAASNVQFGDGMKTALRGISGLASMTGREYDDIASIFTASAGLGKATNNEFDRLAQAGLNARATMAEYLREIGADANATEASVREMAAKGEIDFATFAAAMDWAYGEHAKEANATFTGAMSNVKAALSRIGEKFATPFINNMREVFVSLIPFLNLINTSLAPVVTFVADGMARIKDAIVGLATGFTDATKYVDEFGMESESAAELTQHRFVGIFTDIIAVLQHFGKGIEFVFGTIAYYINSTASSSANVLAKIAAAVHKFREFVEGTFVLSDQISSKLTKHEFATTIKDIVSTVRLLGDAIVRVGASFFQKLIPAAEKLFPIFTSLVKVWNSFIRAGIQVAEPILNTFFDILAKGADIIRQIADKLSSWGINSKVIDQNLQELTKDFGSWFNKITQHLPSFDNFGKILDTVHNKISEFLSTFKGGDFSFLDGLGKAIGSIVKALKEAVAASGIIDSIKEFIGGIKLNDIFGGLNLFMFAGMFSTFMDTFGSFIKKAQDNTASLRNFFKTTTTITKDGTQVLERTLNWDFFNLSNLIGFGPAVNSIKVAFTELQGAIKADILKRIASAMLAVAGALLVLSLIPQERMVSAAFGMLVIVPALKILLDTIGSLPMMRSIGGASVTQLSGMSALIISLGLAIGAIATAMLILGSMKPDKLARSMLGMVGVVGALVAIIYAIGNLPEGAVLKGGGTLIALSLGIFNIAIAMKILGSIQGDSLNSAIASLSVITVVITAIVALVGYVTKTGGKFAAAALLFGAMGGMFVALSIAMKILSLIPLNEMGSAILGLSFITLSLVSLLAVVSALNPVKIAVGSLAFATMGGLFVAMAAALKLMNTIPVESAALSGILLTSFVGILVGFVAALGSIGGRAALGTAALAGIAVALLAIAPAMKLISSIPIEGVIALLIGLGGAFAIIGAAAALIPIPQLLGLASSLLLMGLAATAFGASVALIGFGVAFLVTAFSELMSVFSSTADFIIDKGAALAVGLGTMLKSFAEYLKQNGTEIGKNFVEFFAQTLSSIATLIPQVVQLALNFVAAFITGLANGMGSIISASIDIIINFIAGISSKIGDVVEAAMWVGIMFIKGLADGIRENAQYIGMAITSLVQSISAVLLRGLADMISHIPGIGPKIAEGLYSSANDLAAAAEESSSAIQEKFDEKFGDVVTKADETKGEIADTLDDPSAYEPAGAAVVDGLGIGMEDALQNLPSAYSEQLSSVMTQMTESADQSGEAGSNFGLAFTESASTEFAKLSEKVPPKVKEVADEAGEVDSGTPGQKVGDNFGSGFWQGLDSWQGRINTKASDMVTTAKNAANAAMDANSPAKDLIKSGGYFGEGFAIGIGRMTSMVCDAAAGLVTDAEDQITGFDGFFADTLDAINWDSEPVIRPVLDLSNIQNGAGLMSGMFGGNRMLGYVGINRAATNGFVPLPAAESAGFGSDTYYQLIINDAMVNDVPEIRRVILDTFDVVARYGGMNRG